MKLFYLDPDEEIRRFVQEYLTLQEYAVKSPKGLPTSEELAGIVSPSDEIDLVMIGMGSPHIEPTLWSLAWTLRARLPKAPFLMLTTRQSTAASINNNQNRGLFSFALLQPHSLSDLDEVIHRLTRTESISSINELISDKFVVA